MQGTCFPMTEELGTSAWTLRSTASASLHDVNQGSNWALEKAAASLCKAASGRERVPKAFR